MFEFLDAASQEFVVKEKKEISVEQVRQWARDIDEWEVGQEGPGPSYEELRERERENQDRLREARQEPGETLSKTQRRQVRLRRLARELERAEEQYP